MVNIQKWKHKLSLQQIRFWIYGDSGVGKTRFGATWPDPLFLLADLGGLMSVDIEVDHIDIKSWSDMQDAWRFLKTGEHKYKTVIFDTLNEIQHLAMQNVLSRYPEVKRSYQSLPGKSDYGKSLYDFDIMVREFLDFPIHTVLISQLRRKVYENDPIQPQLTGKQTVANLARKMSVIGYMYRGPISDPQGGSKIVPMMGFNEQEYESKDRTGCLPATIIEPTYAQCAAYWKK